ncbi:hypothetical protein RF11_14555 [Thelohanellus kitauei]|uniref:Uncharacterized protein n=1 Tax=Thelohanellus kitauei TaxID=669202 RepID=A0A0C2N9K6_THEKT|nr:hypothetical protein RF11_14555 [Thelohanellus kitauei]
METKEVYEINPLFKETLIVGDLPENGAFQDDVIAHSADIIKITITGNGVSYDDYFDVYCHFNNVVDMAMELFEVAQSTCPCIQCSYVNLKPLIEKLPETNLGLQKVTTKGFSYPIETCSFGDKILLFCENHCKTLH